MQILFLGPQGSGKGTQSKKLSERTKLPHLASGDLLRQAVADGTPAGKEAKQFIDAGKLVPDPTLIAMFEEQLPSPRCRNGFILDGFPRNVSQARALDALLERLKKPMTCVINLAIDDELAMERMTGRRMCPKCGALYHMKFQPPGRAIPLEKLELPVSAYNLLKQANVRSLADLLRLPYDELLKIKNLDKQSATQVLERTEIFKGAEICDNCGTKLV